MDPWSAASVISLHSLDLIAAMNSVRSDSRTKSPYHFASSQVISDAGQLAPPIVVHIRPPEILPATGASVAVSVFLSFVSF